MGRPAPVFWWDHDLNDAVIVQSDYPGGEVLARFPVQHKKRATDMSPQIKLAENLIADFYAGRKTPDWYAKL